MKTKNITLIALLVLLTGFASCKKDHDIPTGKVFNGGSGGGSTTDSLTISVTANPSEGGTVSGSGKYLKGKTCVVTASANEGYVFSNWMENGIQVSTSVSYSFTVDIDRALVANFSVSSGNNYTITAISSPEYGGIVNGSGTYQQGQNCTVTATANDGYVFTNWTENGAQVSNSSNYTFSVNGNRTLMAHFTSNIQNYSISVSADPSNGGTVMGGGTYLQGQTCSLIASANDGFVFNYWEENGSQVSLEETYTFTVTHNRTLLAKFTPCSQNSIDTLTIMQWDLLEYGNYNSSFADCYETNNNTQHKDECIRTLIEYVKPDIFTVCSFGATQVLMDAFLNNNLNINGADYWQSDNIINYAGSNIVNHIFFDSRKMGLKKHVALRTSPRDTDIYELYLKTNSLVSGDTIKLICIAAHPKAGGTYEANRRVLIQSAMDYVNDHYSSDNVLIMGNFNMYGASESGYQLLTQTYSNPNCCFLDPVASLGGVGEWNNNGQFAAFHTQSTRNDSYAECFSSGGMDDRFDMILMADEIGFGYKYLRFVQGSYTAIGNDGNHFNLGINESTNLSVPSNVLDALYDCSDHLPVTMKIVVER